MRRHLLTLLLLLVSVVPAAAQTVFTGYLALGTATGSWSEVNAGGYARQPVTIVTASNGAYAVNADGATFGPATTAWSPITERGLYDSATGGNLIAWWQVPQPVSVASGSTSSIGKGDVKLTFAAPLSDGTGLVRQWAVGQPIGKTDTANAITAGVSVMTGNGAIAAANPASVGAMSLAMLGQPNGPAQLNGGGVMSLAQLPVGTSAGTVASGNDLRWASTVNALSLGADPSGTSDSTAAIKAAIATGKCVVLPEGFYVVSDQLTLTNHCMRGDGPVATQLLIANNFNPSAAGVIVASGTDPGLDVRDLGITFAQPSTQTSRAAFLPLSAGCTIGAGGTGCQYPWAIVADNATRFRLENVRITGAWDGISAMGNTGGYWAQNLEVGALDIGWNQDGGLDFCHLLHFHAWPFGFTAGSLITAYTDGATVAANLGRCDGFQAVDFDTLAAVNITTNFTTGSISGLHLDGDAANLTMNAAAGVMKITDLYSTKGTPTTSGITMQNGVLTIANIDVQASSEAPVILTTGGNLIINGGFINQDALDQPAAAISGGTMILHDLLMLPASGTHSSAFVVQTGGALDVQDDKWIPGSGSGFAVSIGVDGSDQIVANNDFATWGGISLPAASSYAGTYVANGGGISVTGTVYPSRGLRLPVTTVAALPACNTAEKGMMYAVSDATSPSYNAAVTGSGAVSVPVYCNGSAWTAH